MQDQVSAGFGGKGGFENEIAGITGTISSSKA
jgi:hypothetical protein